jgi:hypothetical protein
MWAEKETEMVGQGSNLTVTYGYEMSSSQTQRSLYDQGRVDSGFYQRSVF